MSLTGIKSQIEDLRAQAASIEARLIRSSDAKQAPMRDQLSKLHKKETELIAVEKRTIEKRLFGLTGANSGDPGQILLYRDANDRAECLTHAEVATRAFAAALRSDDKILATAVLARALAGGWTGIVDEYVKQYPAALQDLEDLAQLGALPQHAPQGE